MSNYDYYSVLIKPSWSPPAWLFGPVWTFLYIIIFISFGKVFYSCLKGHIPAKTALPFALNLLFNFAFTPIQFGLKNNYLALLDILGVLITLIWALIAVYPHIRWAAFINIPYLLWVSFAAVLQTAITYLNHNS